MITRYTVSDSTIMYGLSTDSKPTGSEVNNGSTFVEMDTSKIYFYDASGAQWREWGVVT